MRPKPLSYKRAIETCLKHQNLIGLNFTPGTPESGKVARIIIAPYNRILQWQFLNDIHSGNDPDTALAICRDGKYEVLMLSDKYQPDLLEHRPKLLSQFLTEREDFQGAGIADPPASR
jgi:hypothetical protein